MQAPAYKCVRGTSFAVDAFGYGAIPGITAYFLTHFHSDHYGGLSRAWSHGPIYCSEVTARLVALELRVAQEWLHPLPMATWIQLQGCRVILLEANHCPGSVMLLFENKGQLILHTGDFRADEEGLLEAERGMLMVHRCPDVIYLDNTYCSAAYDFPPQSESIADCLRRVEGHVRGQTRLTPIRLAILIGTYLIGKERLALALAKHFKTPIYCATQRKRQILETLQLPELELAGNPHEAMVHLVGMNELNGESLSAWLDAHHPRFTHVLALKPTGWTNTAAKTIVHHDHVKASTGVKRRGVISIMSVPYSEHSSHPELVLFLTQWPAPLIIPTVSSAGRHFRWDGKDAAKLLERMNNR